MNKNHCTIAIMAKAPKAGYCKTRLIPHIGSQRAARLQQQLLEKTVQTALDAQLGPVTVFAAPTSAHWTFKQQRMTQRLRIQTQLGSNLGERMNKAMRDGLKTHQKVIILGTDCPALRPADLSAAMEGLNQFEHVFQPASDGGYVLVASRVHRPDIFRYINWGSSSVMSSTRRRLQQTGASHKELPTLWDLDEISDLRRARAAGII